MVVSIISRNLNHLQCFRTTLLRLYQNLMRIPFPSEFVMIENHEDIKQHSRATAVTRLNEEWAR